jgi:hypothetical protein
MPTGKWHTALCELDAAVSGLRRAGQPQYLPLGLLTLAWLRCLTGLTSSPQAGPEGAQAELNEAWDIAARGPMRLFLPHIYISRARLLCHKEQYPWESPATDLAAARKLIEQCGYQRRKEELEDAEAALNQQRS